jgi:hypothetical protein
MDVAPEPFPDLFCGRYHSTIGFIFKIILTGPASAAQSRRAGVGSLFRGRRIHFSHTRIPCGFLKKAPVFS